MLKTSPFVQTNWRSAFHHRYSREKLISLRWFPLHLKSVCSLLLWTHLRPKQYGLSPLIAADHDDKLLHGRRQLKSYDSIAAIGNHDRTNCAFALKHCTSRAISELTLKPGADSKEMKNDVLEQAMNNPKVDPADTTMNSAIPRMALSSACAKLS